jgi:hypothetical protein
MDQIEQLRVLGVHVPLIRDNEGRRNKSEEGKDRNAKRKDGYGPGMLFLGNNLRWIGELEEAFQNALEKCGGIRYATPAELHKLILQEEKAAQMFKGLTRIHVKQHLVNFKNQKAGRCLVEATEEAAID